MESEMKSISYANGEKESTVGKPKSFTRCMDIVLRVLAFAATLVAALVMGLANETKTVPIQLIPGMTPTPISVPAKMRYSSAFVYFVVANATACAYATLSLILTVISRAKPGGLTLGMTIVDQVMVGLLFSGNGAAAAVGVIGYKGNSHVGWNKVCNTFDKFCTNIKASVLVSLIGSIAFLLLAVISAWNIQKKSQ